MERYSKDRLHSMKPIECQRDLSAAIGSSTEFLMGLLGVHLTTYCFTLPTRRIRANPILCPIVGRLGLNWVCWTTHGSKVIRSLMTSSWRHNSDLASNESTQMELWLGASCSQIPCRALWSMDNMSCYRWATRSGSWTEIQACSSQRCRWK